MLHPVHPLFLAGYIFTYYNSQKSEQRRARIERINAQLRDLLGPLLAYVTATKSAYEACWRQHTPDGTREGFQDALHARPDGPEASAYRQWMVHVLQPLNEKASDIIINGFSLLEGSSINPQLLQLVAHTSAYRVLLERWKNGDHQRFASAISYPDRLEEWVRKEFARLKRTQAELLGVVSPAQKLVGRAQKAKSPSIQEQLGNGRSEAFSGTEGEVWTDPNNRAAGLTTGSSGAIIGMVPHHGAVDGANQPESEKLSSHPGQGVQLPAPSIPGKTQVGTKNIFSRL
ncbi:hypothetical protein DUNSADRAFT_9622 [Dunaliella salina]|uniref:Uncharacterized protein n=1 Tax=Dunaliella salina TaxID=3046 RepID=A0ABQ7H5E0_DUNSA|nr:hypothetical protein DUNSADRAFT_9622 [Dunaliella salina]|eukprot:KAF5842053.1 hypothetical protein DUNSADRAFT_9622 [Dunaliella salina]